MIFGGIGMELSNETYEKIVEVCEEADSFIDEDRIEDAINKYLVALEIIPSPKKIGKLVPGFIQHLAMLILLMMSMKKLRTVFIML